MLRDFVRRALLEFVLDGVPVEAAPIEVDDIGVFVSGFLSGNAEMDFSNNGELNLDDIEIFVSSFLAGCG